MESEREIAIKSVKENPLDRERWIALGKAMGWNYNRETGYGGENKTLNIELGKYPMWKTRWYRFIDHLAEGKTPETFFEEITL